MTGLDLNSPDVKESAILATWPRRPVSDILDLCISFKAWNHPALIVPSPHPYTHTHTPGSFVVCPSSRSTATGGGVLSNRLFLILYNLLASSANFSTWLNLKAESMEGWMTWDFTPISTVFQSYQGDRRVIMHECKALCNETPFTTE